MTISATTMQGHKYTSLIGYPAKQTDHPDRMLPSSKIYCVLSHHSWTKAAAGGLGRNHSFIWSDLWLFGSCGYLQEKGRIWVIWKRLLSSLYYMGHTTVFIRPKPLVQAVTTWAKNCPSNDYMGRTTVSSAQRRSASQRPLRPPDRPCRTRCRRGRRYASRAC